MVEVDGITFNHHKIQLDLSWRQLNVPRARPVRPRQNSLPLPRALPLSLWPDVRSGCRLFLFFFFFLDATSSHVSRQSAMFDAL